MQGQADARQTRQQPCMTYCHQLTCQLPLRVKTRDRSGENAPYSDIKKKASYNIMILVAIVRWIDLLDKYNVLQYFLTRQIIVQATRKFSWESSAPAPVATYMYIVHNIDDKHKPPRCYACKHDMCPLACTCRSWLAWVANHLSVIIFHHDVKQTNSTGATTNTHWGIKLTDQDYHSA